MSVAALNHNDQELDELQQIIEGVKHTLLTAIEALSKVSETIPAHYRPRKATRCLKADLDFFGAVTANLPQSFEFRIIDNITSDADLVDISRKTFEKKLRGQFLSTLASDPSYESALRRMGLRDEHLKAMRRSYTPFEAKSMKSLDVSVDHIIDLTHGGDNDFENLSLVPVYFNSMKQVFIDIQKRAEEGRAKLAVIAPIDNCKVPYLPNGFRLTTSGTGPQMKELLGLDLS